MVRAFTNPPGGQRSLPPHFFYGKPAGPIQGYHFLEVGLQAASERANKLIIALIKSEFSKLSSKFEVKKPGKFKPGAGLNLQLITNTKALKDISINKLIEKSFIEASKIAYQKAIQEFNRKKGIADPPAPLPSGKRLPTSRTFKFIYSKSSNGSNAIIVKELGDGKSISKMRALNFGLRRASKAKTSEE